MNPALHERLVRAEQHFLLAVASNDEGSLKVFFQEWSQLARDIRNTKAAGRLDDSTAHLLSKVSQAIEGMTGCMLESGILQESLTCSISELILDLPSSDSSSASRHTQNIAPYHLLFSDLSSSISSKILGQKKLLDSYAYSWLMQNIHYPYPNSMQMQIISDVSGASTTQVELWFQEARDSIGWNKLSRDFFAGSVNAMVTAARRVYLERDKNISFDITFAFTAVKAFAEMLFLENPHLQGKTLDIGSARVNQTMDTDQDHHMGSFMGEPILEHILDPEGILVRSQVDCSGPTDPLPDLSDSDESEEEDTTPPAPIIGYKRTLVEDVLTSHVAGLGRPQKRPRTCSIDWAPSKPGSPPPLPSTLGVSSKTAHMSATPVSSFPSSHLLSPTLPESSPDSPRTISQKRGYTEEILGGAVGSIHTDVSVHRICKRRLSQCASPAPPKRQRRPSPDEYLQPTLQVPVDPGIPVNLDIFDWNSIPDPFSGTAPSMSQPPIFHVPSSDLASQLLEPPDLGYDVKITSCPSSELGSLEDLSSLLQFPIPAGPPPDLSTSFTTSSHSVDPTLPLQGFDFSTITESINFFPPGPTQSSSPLTSSSDPPAPPENLYLSLPPSQPCNASEQPLFELDSSVPPSAFLPFESGTFTEDVVNMWSLFCGES